MRGSATFPGIQKIISATYTLSHGISPGRALLTLAPQRNVQAKPGTLTLKYGKRTIKITDCAIQASTITRNPQGWVTSVEVLDKRRRWGWGAISGQYNTRLRSAGIIKPGTAATPRVLAALCLEAMGEKKYDVRALPNDAQPEVDWDFDTPASALSKLCAELGCRIVLKIDGTVKLVNRVAGPPLKGAHFMAESETRCPQEKPSSLIIVTAPVQYQADFALEPVGLEADGTIKHIDDLSYKPVGGWSKTPAEEFADEEDDLKKEAYKLSVYRMYRILVDATHGVLPRYGRLTSLDQILPIYDQQVDTILQNVDGFNTEAPAAAEVWGAWTDGNEAQDEINTETTLKSHAATSQASFYRRAFQVDRQRGLVVFRQPLYRIVGETVLPARLALRTSVNVRGAATRGLVRAVAVNQLGGNGPPRYIARPDLIFANTGNYTAVDPPRIDGEFSNEASLWPHLRKIMAREMAILNGLGKSESAVYGGLKSINPDGYIQSVAWSVGAGSPTTTTVQANYDPGDIPQVDLGLLRALQNAGVKYAEQEQGANIAYRLPGVVGAP